jgi:hypothetical protein
MRWFIEHSALLVAGWVAFDVLFVIAWARFHSARQRPEDHIKGTVVLIRRNGDAAHSEIAYFDEETGEPFEISFKKTS